MAQSGDRSEYFPKIEAKHGKPVEHWFDQLGMLESDKYPDQIGFLKNEHGFSQAHANAVVMFFRGSTTSKRHASPDDYFSKLTPAQKNLAKAIFRAIGERYPELELVIAWNQPMLRNEHDYVFGLSCSTHHLTINPFTRLVLDQLAQQLANYDVLKYTIRLTLDYEIDKELLWNMVRIRLDEIAQNVAKKAPK
jgi:uncharacterized protein YdhG (YjbR/CyaY superfamily)